MLWEEEEEEELPPLVALFAIRNTRACVETNAAKRGERGGGVGGGGGGGGERDKSKIREMLRCRDQTQAPSSESTNRGRT